MEEKANVSEGVVATIMIGAGLAERAAAGGVWTVEFFNDDGALQWSDTAHNILTTQGKNDIMSCYVGNSATQALYMSAFTAGTPTLTATYAAPVVTEVTTTDMAARATTSWGAASSDTIVGTASLTIAAACTLTGIMMMHGGSGITTPGNTSATGGVLVSEGTLGTAQVISTTGTVVASYSLSL